jgi:hypothetical protein
MQIGRIQRVQLRDIWPHEARDFTTWLCENLEVLNDKTGLGLIQATCEQRAGDFSVDLIATDGAGGEVVIENQLEKSNHDHLGKLITYLAAVGAKAAVWIVSDPRPEHVAAVSWLNQKPDSAFYLLKVEGIRIGESDPAPLLTLITGPSEELRDIGEHKQERELQARHLIRQAFWKQLLEKANNAGNVFKGIHPGVEHWISKGAGKSGLTYVFAVRQHDGQVELYIDTGDEQVNQAIFDQLLVSKAEIESSFGEPLEWEPLEGKRACRIKKVIDDLGGWQDEPAWPELQDAMVDAMTRLQHALRPKVAAISVPTI